jgi:uroporphyrin-III C-methyltransferase
MTARPASSGTAHPVAGPPDWLRARLLAALDHLGRPAGPDAAIGAIAARYQCPPGEVLLVTGAADALTRLARTLPPGRAACAGPAATEAATILRAAGHDVRPVPLAGDGTLDPGQVPGDADLVVVAGRASPGGTPELAPLARPGRILVIDETQAGEPQAGETACAGHPPAHDGQDDDASAAARHDLPGLVRICALARVWGLDGLGAGYLLADASLVRRLHEAQPAPPLSALALVALEACSQPEAVAWAAGPATPSPRTARPAATAPEAGPPGRGRTLPAGTVTLIGAGPGGSDLITMRGWLALHEADVVVADRLADPGLTRQLRPGVLLINAGKAPGAQQLSQDQINRVLTGHARAGRRVARLKGGDPFVFGRGGEEAAACAAAGIACTVIPGLSSALAGPALAGIAVTHREIGQSFTVVSGHLPPDHPDSRVDWKALAAGSDTLVLLMAVRNLRAIAGHLVACGTPPGTPAACVQDAGTGQQQVFRGTLGGLADPAAAPPVRNPAVIIIGPTAGDPGAPDLTGQGPLS